MYAPRLFVAITLASVLTACSKPQPKADAELDRALDLALHPAAGAVVSQVELGAEPAAKPSPEPSRARSVARATRQPRPAVIEPAPEPAPAEPAATEETVAVAPAPEPVMEAPAPEPQPTREPHPVYTGRGRSGPFPGGQTDGIGGGGEGVMRIPGIGGVVIIRGGGSGYDPCDERHTAGRGGMMGPMGPMGGIAGVGAPAGMGDRARMGAGRVLMNPRSPATTGVRGGWNGGGGGGGRFGGR